MAKDQWVICYTDSTGEESYFGPDSSPGEPWSVNPWVLREEEARTYEKKKEADAERKWLVNEKYAHHANAKRRIKVRKWAY